MTKVKRLDPIPPGEILLEEFMRPNGISQNRLARDLDVNPARVNNIGVAPPSQPRWRSGWQNISAPRPSYG